MLAVDEGGELPTEFRLFVKGWNETENGRFLFDDKAAAQVMAAYKTWGVDLAIDLDHQMLSGPSTDPTARDARGWCKLEVRPDGSLWAVDVRWTEDGAERLSQKRQRYVSPAFEVDPKTKRVSKVLNVAITAMPATHKTPALVAASASGGGMDPSLVKQALEAIEKSDAKAALELLKGLVASAAGAEPEPDGDEAGSEGDGAEGYPTDPSQETESVEDPKVVDATAEPEGDEGEEPEGDEGNDKNPMKKAASVMLCAITGAKTVMEALDRVELYKAAYDAREVETKRLARERAQLEADERRRLCVQLIQLKAEFPATIWADSTSKQPVKLKSRWQNMPIAELRAHVAEQRASRGSSAAPSQVRPPKPSADPVVAQLTPEQLAICEQLKCDPKEFAALQAIRDGKKG